MKVILSILVFFIWLPHYSMGTTKENCAYSRSGAHSVNSYQGLLQNLSKKRKPQENQSKDKKKGQR